MRKIYSTILAAACVAFTASAGRVATEDGLKVSSSKQLRSTTELTVKKDANSLRKTGKYSVNPDLELKMSKLAGKKVTKMRKADAKEGIEGLWDFDLGDYYFQTSVGSFTHQFEATVSGNEVEFADPTGYELPFYGIIDGDQITFTREYLGTMSGYQVYQEPFVFDYDLMDLVFQDITATYYDYNGGIIDFESDNGISWSAYTRQSATQNDALTAGAFSIYDLEGATKAANEEDVTLDEVQEGQWKTIGNATFVDAWIIPTYSMGGVQLNPNEYIYEVELQQNVDNEYLYRLWKPYTTENFPLYELNQSTYEGQIIFDVSDPDHVVVIANDMPAGFKNSNGQFYLSNELGWYCNYVGGLENKDYIISVIYGDDAETEPDTFKDGVITINTPMFDFSAAHADGYSLNNNPYQCIITFPKTEPEPGNTVTVEGNLTTQIDMNMGQGDPDLEDPDTYKVTAVYDADAATVTLSNFVFDEGPEKSGLDDLNPLKLTIDAASGTVTGAAGQVSSIDDGDPSDPWTFYYGDVETGEQGVSGTIMNLNDSECRITLDTWGQGMDFMGGLFFAFVYYNTEITLPFAVEGAPYAPQATINSVQLDPTGDNEVTLTVDYSTAYLPANSTVYVEVRRKWAPEGGALEVPVLVKVVESSSSPEAIVINDINLGDYVEFEATVIVKNSEDKTIATSEAVDSNGFQFTSVDSILNDNAPARYFNLQGVEIAKPENGVFIRVEGNKAVKVIR